MTAQSRPCRIEGCDYPRTAKGMCGTHYGRYRRHGDPHSTGSIRLAPAVLARLRADVGLPAEGPTEEHRQRWNDQEAVA